MSGNISRWDVLIENCDAIIQMLDGYEEARCLHISEWNFGATVEERLLHLLDC